MSNLVHKIIRSHLVSGEMIPGAEIGISIDNTLIHDATGQMAMLQFEALEISRVKTKRSVTFIDHNTLQLGFENMDDHQFLASASRKFGLYYSRAGNGICHQVNLERLSIPGDTLLGADSHTTTAGGAGMLAIGAGGLDVSVAMAGQPFFLPMPKVMEIRLTGKLPDWSAAKDVALEALRRLNTSGGLGKILEFTGDGVKGLSTSERATIANMSIECGAFTAIFPSDENTRQYFLAQKRENDWKEIQADPEAEYDEVMHIDLSQIEPLVALPHSPGKVVPVSQVKDVRVDQVAIGSCTNSSLEDMLRVAEILKGKSLPAHVSLIIAPASRQVLMDLTASGALKDMLTAGARLMEPACGFCNGVGQAPCSKGISVRTSNRNFPGRSGTSNASLYLVSPQTAAATAVTGSLSDPRSLGRPVQVSLPRTFAVDDSLLIPPASDFRHLEITRGPNIAPLPRFEAMPDNLEGELLLTLGDNVTTDDILPAGAHILAKRANIPAISDFIFSTIDPTFARRAQEAGIGFVLGGKNYGQGSSREHAALAPRYLGVRAVLAESFARIHKFNLINFGILPLELINPEDASVFRQGDTLRISNVLDILEGETEIAVQNTKNGQKVTVKLDVSSRLRGVLLHGGTLNYTKRMSS